jgi:hypothetical protein
MSVISLSNVVSITITPTPTGVIGRNINTIGLFTTESPSNTDTFRVYISAQDVEEAYGTGSVTSQMANNIFAQNPNIRTPDGSLVILPLDGAISATSGKSDTANLGFNIENLIGVSDGNIRIVLNGNNYDLFNLNFTNVTTIEGIVDVIKNKFYKDNSNIVFEAFQSENVLRLSDGGLGTNLQGANLLDGSQALLTSGVLTTIDLTSNLTFFDSVTDGSLKIGLNQVIYTATDLVFDSSVTVQDIVDVLTPAFPDIDIEINAGDSTKIDFSSSVSTGNNAMRMTAKTVGEGVTISHVETQTVPDSPPGVDLSDNTHLDSPNQIVTEGTDSSGTETLLDAIARTTDTVFYYGIMTNLEMQDAVISSTAASIQAKEKIFLHHFASTEALPGIVKTISDSSQYRTRPLLYTNSISSANLMKASYVGRALVTDATASNTSMTMNMKILANVTPDANLTQTLYEEMNTNGADGVVNYELAGGKVFDTIGNRFFDDVYTDDQMFFALQAAGANHLIQTAYKIPQTEPAMTGLKAAFANVFKQFLRNGALAPGKWTAPDTFGDKQTFLDNIRDFGYYIYSQPITQQSATDREQRKAPLIQAAVKRAGAIHIINLTASVNA